MKELFQTKRLYVRSLRKTDLENFQKLLDHPKVKKFTNGKGILSGENASVEIICEFKILLILK